MSRNINLYDASFRKQRDWLSSKNVVLSALLATLLVTVGAGFARWSLESRSQQAKSINSQLLGARAAFSEMTRVLSSRKTDPALVAQVEAAQSNLSSAHTALGLLRGMVVDSGQPIIGEMMRAFSRSSNDGLWLTGFVVADGGRQLEIRGRMVDQALLPPYLRRLESEPVFQGRRFAGLEMKGGQWIPPVDRAAAVAPVKEVEKKPEPWFVEFAMRTTDLPKSPSDSGVAR